MNQLLNILALGAQTQLQGNLQSNPANGATNAENGVAGEQGSESPFAVLMTDLSNQPANAEPTIQSTQTSAVPQPSAEQTLPKLTGETGFDLAQLVELINQLPKEALLSIHEKLFGGSQAEGKLPEFVPSLSKGQSGLPSALEPHREANLNKELVSEHARESLAGFRSDQVRLDKLSVISDSKATPLVHARANIDAELSAHLLRVSDRSAQTSSYDKLGPDQVQAIKSELLIMARDEPRVAQNLVDHLRQLFPELELETAELTATVRKSNEASTLPADDAREFLTDQSTKSFFNKPSQLSKSQLQADPLTPPVDKSQFRMSEHLDNQAESKAADSSQTGEARPAAIKGSINLAQQHASPGTTNDLFKALNSGQKKSDNNELNLGEALTKGDSSIKLDNQQPARAVNAAQDVESFRIVLRRTHVDALLQRGEVKLQLKPEHLGNLRIELVSDKSQMHARLEASSQEARAVIENNLPQLRESFDKLGIRLGQIDVTVSDDRLPQHHGRFEHAHQGNQKRFNGMTQSETVEVTPAALPNSAPLHAGGLNLLA